jgi:hypothetical protein
MPRPWREWRVKITAADFGSTPPETDDGDFPYA